MEKPQETILNLKRKDIYTWSSLWQIACYWTTSHFLPEWKHPQQQTDRRTTSWLFHCCLQLSRNLWRGWERGGINGSHKWGFFEECGRHKAKNIKYWGIPLLLHWADHRQVRRHHFQWNRLFDFRKISAYVCSQCVLPDTQNRSNRTRIYTCGQREKWENFQSVKSWFFWSI